MREYSASRRGLSVFLNRPRRLSDWGGHEMKFFTVRSGLLWFVIPFLCLTFSEPLQAQVREARIADSKGDWGYPNPYRHYPRGPGYVRMSWVFDTLVWKDQKGYMPALADSWSYDPGKLAFTFNLNPRAKWHDGQPLTAQDVVFTIEYFKKHPYSWISVDGETGPKPEDPTTVIIYLSKPYSPFHLRHRRDHAGPAQTYLGVGGESRGL